MNFEEIVGSILNGNSMTPRVDRQNMQLGAVRGSQGNLIYGNPSGGRLVINNLLQRIEVYDTTNNLVITLDKNGLIAFDANKNKLSSVDSTGFKAFSVSNQQGFNVYTKNDSIIGSLYTDGTNLELSGNNGIVIDPGTTGDIVLSVGNSGQRVKAQLSNTGALFTVEDGTGNIQFAVDGQANIRIANVSISGVATPATVNNKLAIYSPTGTLIGYIPIYNSL